MTLLLTLADRIARARAELRLGLPVIVTGPNTASLVFAVELLRDSDLATIRQLDMTADLAITARRAETLKARAYDGDLARIAVPADADAAWARAVINPAADLDTPMKGPFRSLRQGSAEIHRAAILLCKQAHLLPAALVASIPPGTVLEPGIGTIALDDLAHSASLPLLTEVSSANVPLSVAPSRVLVFRGDDGDEHYAIEIGTPDRSAPVLGRLHSACFTGDLLGSLKCDCGAQLQGALAQMAAQGSGVLLYLNQEGRGIGLANKLRAYGLQDQGFDTVEANHRLGFEDDERDFRLGAQMLKAMGFTAIRLMTNNPAKVDRMNSCGIKVVERVPLKLGHTPQNAAYLATKARKSGHLL